LRACYLDASAIVKLATVEAETAALREHLAQYDARVTSRLSAVEVPRALARRGPDSVRVAADALTDVMGSLQLVELTEEVASHAATLEPATVRSLDAVHLASALAVGTDLEALITYDTRLAAAARASGLTVQAPA
jgi:predicted nucleic acid-binding protein